MSEEQLTDKIKKELLKSGFPLELRCRRAISQEGWMLMLDRFYLDSENVEHEIDAIAYKDSVFSTQSSPDNMVSSVLIVECKKNEGNHWVFFHEGLGLEVLNLISTLNPQENERMAFALLDPEPPLRGHHYSEVELTSSYAMAFRKGKNQIFEGLQELFSAYKHEREMAEEHMSSKDQQKGGLRVNVYYPTVVFDGNLFIAKLANEDLEVKEVDQTLYTERHPSYLDTWIATDIVRADFFAKYLKRLEQDHQIIVSYIQSKFARKDS